MKSSKSLWWILGTLLVVGFLGALIAPTLRKAQTAAQRPALAPFMYPMDIGEDGAATADAPRNDGNSTHPSLSRPRGVHRGPALNFYNGAPSTGNPVPSETAAPDDVEKELRFRADELWVISAPESPSLVRNDDSPGSGELRAKLPDQPKEVPLPLKHTDVKASISAYVATVNVKQQYHNPYDQKIEAIYVFPLPQNAAINEFLMIIGERRIRGIIRPRAEARRIYNAAKRQGHVASLLTQERPNIFTQSVANIEPGKKIDIDIKYFHTLKYSKGEYEFVFPMVVGPRYNPPGTTDGVAATSWGKPGKTSQQTEVHYLKPNQRSGHDISVSVDIDAGVSIEKVWSPSHKIEAEVREGSMASVKLASFDQIPNKDLVLRYKVAGNETKTGLLVHRGKQGNYFTLMVQPPAELDQVERTPREMIFVLDCSGSMSGIPIQKAKSAIQTALKKLRPSDTFQIIRFSNNASQLGASPLPATDKNIQHGLQYLAGLSGSGGTQMIEGIKAALDFPHSNERFRIVSFMTDGFIGNDRQILGEVKNRLGAARIFSFGVGSSPNRYLLERMALLGKGAVAWIGLDDNSGLKAVDRFYEMAGHVALTDIEIDWGGMKVETSYPANTPDLFVGRPIVLTGKFTGEGRTTVKVSGRAGSIKVAYEIPINLESAEQHPGLASVWARQRISDLADLATYSNERQELTSSIQNIALKYGLMSEFTAFVAVDSMTKTAGNSGVTVAVPVPGPAGVRYDTPVE